MLTPGEIKTRSPASQVSEPATFMFTEEKNP